MGAQKHPPKLRYGDSGCKIQYQIFDFHAISLDGMVIGAKTLILPQELHLGPNININININSNDNNNRYKLEGKGKGIR